MSAGPRRPSRFTRTTRQRTDTRLAVDPTVSGNSCPTLTGTAPAHRTRMPEPETFTTGPISVASRSVSNRASRRLPRRVLFLSDEERSALMKAHTEPSVDGRRARL
jgi:hypothetical protein